MELELVGVPVGSPVWSMKDLERLKTRLLL